MKLTLVTLVLLTASTTLVAQTADEAAIRENLRQMETGWNIGSGSLFAKPFAEDADYVVINGMYVKGRTLIAKMHQQIFDTIFKDTTVTLKIRQIRFLRPEVAVVHVDGHRDSPSDGLKQDVLLTLVMTKEKDGWIVAAFQNTAVTATK